MNTRGPTFVSLWFAGCVIVGLVLAYATGVDTYTLVRVALIMTTIALVVTGASWCLARRRRD